MVNPLSDHGTTFIDLFQRFAHEFVGLYFFTRIDEVEVKFALLSEEVVFQQHLLINWLHKYTFLPTVLELAVIKVNLEAGPEDLLRCSGCSTLETYCNLPWDRNDDEFSVFIGIR